MNVEYRGPRSKEGLDVEIARLAATQFDVFSRRQALQIGFSSTQIDRRLSKRMWEMVLPSVYRMAGALPQSRQAAMAASLWAGEDALVSHCAAGVLWGIDGFTGSRVEISVPLERKLRTSKLVVHRTQRIPPVDRSKLGVIPITTPARTIIDSTSMLDDESLEAAVEDGLYRGLFTERFLHWRLEELAAKGRPGVSRLRALLRRRQNAAALESRLEVKVWRLLQRSCLPRPQRQHWVEVDGRRYRLDFAWPDRRVAVEAEGRAVHGGRRRVYYDDRRRLADLVSQGWRVVPVTWDDVTERAEQWLTRVAQTLALAA